MLETTFVIMMFLGLVYMGVDWGRVGYRWMTLHQAATEAARWGSLGMTDVGSSRENSIENRVRTIWTRWGLDPSSLTVHVNSLPSSGGAVVSNNAGNTGDYLIVEAACRASKGIFMDLLTGGGSAEEYALVARGVSRNE